MNVEKWKNHWGFYKDYHVEAVFKELPAFVSKNHKIIKTVCYPASFVDDIREMVSDFYLSEVDYHFIEDINRSHYLQESLAIIGTVDFLEIECSLNIRHDKRKHVNFVSSYHQPSITNSCEQVAVDSFLYHIYTLMNVFIESYSPNRLTMVTERYTRRVPRKPEEGMGGI